MRRNSNSLERLTSQSAACFARPSAGGADGGETRGSDARAGGVGGKHDAWLTDYVKDPKAKNPRSKMPKMQLTDEQLHAVVGYLETLK